MASPEHASNLLPMTKHSGWPRVAVVGAGAVGCYFGGMLARAGVPTTLIGRRVHVEAINRNRLLLETRQWQERITVPASTEMAAAESADLVLFCVKTLDTVTAARELSPHLPKDALLLSLQNGVDNVERIGAATSIVASPAVVYIAAEMAGPGHVRHKGRGELILDRMAEQCSAMFIHAGVPCTLSDNMAAELWTKLLANCAFNAISALSRARYGEIGRSAPTREVMELAMREVLAVGAAAGVRFPATDLLAQAMSLSESIGDATSSTAQDLARTKATEIDSLNGYVVRRARELGIDAPVNQTLHALVKLLERSVGATPPL